MKKNIFFAIVVLLALSCRSVKTTSKQNTDLDLKTNISVKKEIVGVESGTSIDKTINKKDSDLSIIKTVVATGSLIIDSKTTKYDTDKPILSNTGKPPVKEEIHTTTTNQTTNNVNENTSLKYSEKEMKDIVAEVNKKNNSKLDSVSSENKKLEQQLRQATSKTVVWWKWLIVGASIVGLIILSFYLYPGWLGKLLKWILKLFKG